MEEIAPPPYSETDLFSNTNTTILTPAASTADNVSRAGRVRSDTSSTQGSIIYTPPYSPIESNYTLQDRTPSHHSAQDYFNSRSAPLSLSLAVPLQHQIHLTSRSTPDDLPFPQTAAERDVTSQDWATFTNYLLPDHVASANNEVANRKLKAELIDERMQRLTLNEQDHPRLDFTHVDAQLNHLRQPSISPAEIWERYVNDVIDVWNKGFFEPRGLKVVRTEPGNTGRAPLGEDDSPKVSRGRGVRGMNRNHHPFAGCRGPRGGFRMGPVMANNEGLQIGRDGLIADNNGLRMGTSFIANNQGLRMGSFVANEHGVSFGRNMFGGGHGGHGCHGHNRGRDQRGGDRHRGRSHSRSIALATPRWQEREGSLIFVVIDSDSSDSDLSVGSLPDYDHISDQQLPSAKESLMVWLNHPEYPMTKDMIKKLKRDMSSPKPDYMENKDQDLKALRKEVKELLKKFKDEKKSQKKIRKALMKEKREFKKVQKKEKRDVRKAERKARKKEKKGRQHDFYSGPTQDAHGLPRDFNFSLPPQPQFAPGPSFYNQLPHHSFTAVHGSWPFAPQVQSPSFSQGASQFHAKASKVLSEARDKENEAKDIRISLTDESIKEKTRRKMGDKAVALEEQAAMLKREGDRLMAEAIHLDGELAREIQEEDRGE
ncbi:RING finger domain-containing protein [Rutstroemia sp. NJR-2017a WRK4]|nr:RING finger domain-containing protein [Rutstroemia sp. NJR-2017a WRK4]